MSCHDDDDCDDDVHDDNDDCDDDDGQALTKHCNVLTSEEEQQGFISVL